MQGLAGNRHHTRILGVGDPRPPGIDEDARWRLEDEGHTDVSFFVCDVQSPQGCMGSAMISSLVEGCRSWEAYIMTVFSDSVGRNSPEFPRHFRN